MDGRVPIAILVGVLVVSLLAPAGVVVAAPNDVPNDAPNNTPYDAPYDATAPDGADVDVHVFERYHAALAAFFDHARVGVEPGERTRGRSDGRVGGRTETDADVEGVLEQSTRAAVYDAIVGSPGATLSELASSVDVTKSTVRYHARVLRDADMVTATEVGGALRYAPSGADAELAAVRRADGSGDVLEAVAEREPASVSALAAATDRAPSTVSYHLSGLEERGLVERERAGESVVTTLADTARASMAVEQPPVADD